MKTTISNFGKMLKANGRTKNAYAPFSSHILQATLLHERINANASGTYYSTWVKDSYWLEYKAETVEYIKTCLLGGRLKPQFKAELLK